MSVRIAHIADVHFRPLSRHDEQRLIFEYFFEKAKELKVDLRQLEDIANRGDLV